MFGNFVPQTQKRVNSFIDSVLINRYQIAIGFIVLAVCVLVVSFFQAKKTFESALEIELSAAANNITYELSRRAPFRIDVIQQLLNSEDVLQNIYRDKLGPIHALPERIIDNPLITRVAIYDMLGTSSDEVNQLGQDAFSKSIILKSSLLPPGHSLLDAKHIADGQTLLYFAHRLMSFNDKDLGTLVLVYDISEVIKMVASVYPENAELAFMIADRSNQTIASGGKFEDALNTQLNSKNVLADLNHQSGLYEANGYWFSKIVAPYSGDYPNTNVAMPWHIVLFIPDTVINTRIIKTLIPNFLTLSLLLLAVLIVVLRHNKRLVKQRETLVKMLPEPTEAIKNIGTVSLWRFEIGETNKLIGTSLFATLGYGEQEIDINDIDAMLDIVSSEDVPHVKRNFIQLLQQKTDEINIDVKMRHKLGYWVWQNYRIAVYQLDDQGHVKEIIGVTLDITKRKQDEKILMSATHEAERANKLKTDFIANISHEVRTPINAILGYNQLLRLMNLNPKQTNFVDKMKSSTMQLLNRFNQILIYSKLEGDSFEIDLKPTNLENLITSAIDDIAEFQDSPVEINVNLDRSLGKIYTIDKEHLKLVIEMLLNGMVNLTSSYVLNLNITNSGRSKKTHNLLFSIEAMYQKANEKEINAALNRFIDENLDGNTVVNLDIELAHKLLEKMHADLRLNIEEGHRFVMSFKMALDVPDVYHRLSFVDNEDENTTSSDTGFIKFDDAPVESISLENVSALLVDDNATNREVILQILNNLNVSVDIATTGLESIEKLKEKTFDIVFMDIQMPIMDGLEATQIIREDLKLTDLPIVAVTANQFKTDRTKALAAGMNDFIPKPVGAKILKEAIEKWVVGKSIEHEIKQPIEEALNIEPNDIEVSNLTTESIGLSDINPTSSIERLGGDQAMLIKIYQRFAHDFDDWKNETLELARDKEWQKAKIHAHTLKGASSNIDATILSQLAAELESMFASGIIDEVSMMELIDDVQKNLERVIQSIGIYIETNFQQSTEKVEVTEEIDNIIIDLMQKLEKHKRISADNLLMFKTAAENKLNEQDVDLFIDNCNAFNFSAAKDTLAHIIGSLEAENNN